MSEKPKISNEARNLVSEIDQLLMQKLHGEADFVAEKALRRAHERSGAEELAKALTACLSIGLDEGEQYDSEGFIKLGTPRQKRVAEITSQARGALAKHRGER